MATYKVIQDIEAEDKLFGPLTLKQFIFASVAVVCAYLSFWSVANGLVFLLVLFLPPLVFFGALAFPWSKDQTTEVWMMAKLRFYFRPRKRIWDQSGIKELVTITAPKREEKTYSDGLSHTEVKSRLRALADTIDTRGWAVKNVNVNMSAPLQAPGYIDPTSDRLVGASSTVQEVASYDAKADDDMYDEHYNPTAQHFDTMIEQSTKDHRQQLVSRLNQPEPPQPPQSPQPQQPQQPQQTTPAQPPQNDYWFMRQPSAPAEQGTATFAAAPVVPPGQPQKAPLPQTEPQQQAPDQMTEAEEQRILDTIHKQQSKAPNTMNSHLKTIQPLSEHTDEAATPAKAPPSQPNKAQPPAEPEQSTEKTTGNRTAHADILNLANNNDLNVETIARQANKSTDDSLADEVVVSLH